MKRFLFLICIVIVVMACKEIYEAPPQALLQAYFLDSSTKKPVTPLVSVQGIGRDMLWISDTILSGIVLPLSLNDTTSFLISFDSKVDKIAIIHSSTQKYASMETGFYYEYKLKAIESSHNRIDSIQITDSLITKDWHENIKIYIHPLPAGTN